MRGSTGSGTRRGGFAFGNTRFFLDLARERAGRAGRLLRLAFGIARDCTRRGAQGQMACKERKTRRMRLSFVALKRYKLFVSSPILDGQQKIGLAAPGYVI